MQPRVKAGLRDPRCGSWGYPESPPAGPQVRCKLILNHADPDDHDFGPPESDNPEHDEGTRGDHAEGSFLGRRDKRPISRSDYTSTVAGRDVPAPVAPIPAHERHSAARDDGSPGDDTSGGESRRSGVQGSLLPRCPGCGTSIKQLRVNICKDEWHDS